MGRFIIETDPKDNDTILEISKHFDVEIKKIGNLNGYPEINIRGLKSQSFKLNVEKMKELFDSTIPSLMDI